MKQQIFIKSAFLFLLLLSAFLQAQSQQNYTFKEPAVKIDFGTGNDAPGINIFPLSHYSIDNSTCPNDGYYSFASHTSDCFNGDWLTFNEDHTPGDEGGRMMLVNASPEGGVFFNTIITGLHPGATYELSAWMVNVCRISGGCPPLPPDISIKLLTATGKKIVSFQTGLLSQNASPHWKVYSGLFTTPADINTLIMTMEDITTGGCGNDFALDDIVIRERVVSTPANVPIVKRKEKLAEKPIVAVTKALVKKATSAIEPAVKKTPAIQSRVRDTAVTTVPKQVTDTREVSLPAIKAKSPVLIAEPKPILTRANPLIKQIETGPGEIVIDLYDNGEIDGDTVSVYHNNKLIVSRGGLSLKPITFRIKVDASHPHHEIIMVANNLGSIPPNTSMMIVTTSNKRYEVFISSSEEKNAKVLIDLKE